MGAKMKKAVMIASMVAFTGISQSAVAGSLADPVIEAPLIVEDATSSSSGASLVLALAILLSIPVLTD